MTPTAIIKEVVADGVRLALTPTGTIKATGDQVVVARWLPVIRENKPAIVAALKQAANETVPTIPRASQYSQEAFEFTPPGDPANDDEALAERVAIMSVENGWSEAQALQETRWHADRERCWRAFLCNAERILAAPEGERSGLLTIYAAEASACYGERTGADMAASLRGWVNARAVH